MPNRSYFEGNHHLIKWRAARERKRPHTLLWRIMSDQGTELVRKHSVIPNFLLLVINNVVNANRQRNSF